MVCTLYLKKTIKINSFKRENVICQQFKATGCLETVRLAVNLNFPFGIDMDMELNVKITF
jgi:hypothetical protein